MGHHPHGGGVARVVALVLALTSAPVAAETLCLGRTNSGALRGARRLEERPYLRIKRGSEDRTWGHPALLALVYGGARAVARAADGSVALVGDASAEHGGLLSGHASHQSGRDVDVGFFVADASGQSVALEAFEPFDGSGRSMLDPRRVFDVYRNWVMLRAWLSELRVVVTHVFVSGELRQLIIDYGRQSPEFARYVSLAAAVLHPHPNHGDHFHVRIACPLDQGKECVDASGQP
jgi:penicillin-insensitive murein endopeptidase